MPRMRPGTLVGLEVTFYSTHGRPTLSGGCRPIPDVALPSPPPSAASAAACREAALLFSDTRHRRPGREWFPALGLSAPGTRLVPPLGQLLAPVGHCASRRWTFVCRRPAMSKPSDMEEPVNARMLDSQYQLIRSLSQFRGMLSALCSCSTLCTATFPASLNPSVARLSHRERQSGRRGSGWLCDLRCASMHCRVGGLTNDFFLASPMEEGLEAGAWRWRGVIGGDSWRRLVKDLFVCCRQTLLVDWSRPCLFWPKLTSRLPRPGFCDPPGMPVPHCSLDVLVPPQKTIKRQSSLPMTTWK